jgi:hypothetical protein
MSDQSATPSEDPRDQGTGQGYPESNQEEATPREGTEEGPAAGTDESPAPDTTSDDEGDAQQATGNPDAAG